MRAQRNDFVVSDQGALARLKGQDDVGWSTWGGGFISDAELAAHWRIVTMQDGKEFYGTHGRKIDPPEPETERVHWSKLINPQLQSNRKLACDAEVTYVAVFGDGSASIKATGGNEVRTGFDGMVEVLVDE